MAIVTSNYCLDDFTIQITGGVPCALDVDSSNKIKQYDANELVSTNPNPLAQSVNEATIPFTYKVGAPEKTDFASIYTKSRENGISGQAPDLGGRTFNRPSPDQTGAANALKNAVFR